MSRCQSSRPGVNDPEDAKAYASASLAGNGGARTRCPAWSGCGTGSRLAHLRHQPGQRHLGIAQSLPPGKYASSGTDWLTSYAPRSTGPGLHRLGYIKGLYCSPFGAWDHEVDNNRS